MSQSHPAEVRLPVWIRVGLLTLLTLQIAATALFLWFTPEGWSRILRIPFFPARLAMIFLAGLLTATAFWVLFRPSDSLLLKARKMIGQLRNSPFLLILPVLIAVPALWLLTREWAGFIVLGIEGLLLAAGLLMLTLRESQRQWWVSVAVVALASGIGLRLWWIQVGTFGDEGFFLSAAANMAQGGGIAPAGIRLPVETPHRPEWGWLLTVYGAWGRVFGVGKLSLRYLGLLLGLPVIPIVYLTARLWYGRLTAWITAGAAAISVMGLFTVAARNNSLPMLTFAIVLLAHIYARKQEKQIWHTLVGVLAVIGLEAHLINLSLLGGLGMVYLVEYLGGLVRGERVFRRDPLWVFGLGVVPALAAYLALHLLPLPDPAAYLAYMKGYSAGGGLLATLWGWLRGFVPHYVELWQYSPVECLLILAALPGAAFRRTQADRHWLLLMAAHEVTYLVVRPQGVINFGYTSTALPLFVMGVGSLMSLGLAQEEKPHNVLTRISVLAGLLMMLAFSINTIHQSSLRRQEIDRVAEPIVQELTPHLSEASVLMGSERFYPYVAGADYLFPPSLTESTLGPVLSGRNHDAYWLDVMLETWPRAFVGAPDVPPSDPPFYGIEESYFRALEADRLLPRLWVVPDDNLVTAPANESALQLIAYYPIDSVSPDLAFLLKTIWVTRAEIDVPVSALLTLRLGGNEEIVSGEAELVDDVYSLPVDQWTAYRFYGITMRGDVPAATQPGDYSLELRLQARGPDTLCTPNCAFDLGHVTIRE